MQKPHQQPTTNRRTRSRKLNRDIENMHRLKTDWGMGYQQIADMYGLPVVAIQQKVFKFRRTL